MSRLKAFIIDPHVLVRQTIASIIREEQNISISGCSNGEDENEVMNTIHAVSPDVVLFGIDEPGSASEKLFQKLRKEFPLLPIIVMTPLNKKGANIALKSLREGAVEFITKPERSGCLTLSANHFQKRVIPALRMVPRLNMTAVSGNLLHRGNSDDVFNPGLSSYYNLTNRAELVVVGGCTGGVRALYKMISSLPASFPVPVMVIQHMPKIYTESLAIDLDQYSALKVNEAKNINTLLPGYVYIAPGGYHTIIKNDGKRRTISLYKGPKVHRSRPSIDVLFWSAAQMFRDKTFGVLLSGEGEDGVEGSKHIINAGGQVITESRRSAVLWDLPRYVEEKKLSEGSYSADKLSSEIIRRIYSGKQTASEKNQAHISTASVPDFNLHL